MTYFQAELNEALEKIQKVRQIHCPDPLYANLCNVCLDFYPCPTIKALDGEQ